MNPNLFCRAPPLILSTIGIMLLFVLDCINFSFSILLAAAYLLQQQPRDNLKFGLTCVKVNCVYKFSTQVYL